MYYTSLRLSVSLPINQLAVESLHVQSPAALKGLGRAGFILGGLGGGFEALSAVGGSGAGSSHKYTNLKWWSGEI